MFAFRKCVIRFKILLPKENLMKIKTVFGLLMIMALLLSFGTVSAAPPASGYSTLEVGSPDCRVIMPWPAGGGPANYQYPIIAWANGWDSQGSDTVAGYTGGLSAWALDGPYIIIADKSRSPKVTDLVACLDWMVKQNTVSGSVFNGKLNTNKIGLSGHSQGGGVAIMAGNAAYNIVGVIGMNPYQANWNGANKQKGPVLIFAGSADTTTPVAKYAQPAYNKVKTSGKGAVLAILQGGDHSDQVWLTPDFTNYQQPSNMFWRKVLNDDPNAGATLKSILDSNPPWTTSYTFTSNFTLP
jgi:predicted dienelactone hydrolase